MADAAPTAADGKSKHSRETVPVTLPKRRPMKARPKADAGVSCNDEVTAASVSSGSKKRAVLVPTKRALLVPRRRLSMASPSGYAAHGSTPKGTVGALTTGHPLCIYSRRDGSDDDPLCDGSMESRIVRHVFATGKLGDIYCQECWYKITAHEERKHLMCRQLGHPKCTQFVPAEGHDADHMCVGTDEDELVQHVRQGELLDVYCVTCWNGLKQSAKYKDLHGVSVA